ADAAAAAVVAVVAVAAVAPVAAVVAAAAAERAGRARRACRLETVLGEQGDCGRDHAGRVRFLRRSARLELRHYARKRKLTDDRVFLIVGRDSGSRRRCPARLADVLPSPRRTPL